MGARQTFTTTIIQEGKTATGIVVPQDVVDAFGIGKKPPVKVTIKDYTYRSTVAVMGGRFLIPLSAENRNGAGVAANEEVDVTLELDSEPRTVEVPEDLKLALLAKNGAWESFESLAFSKRKEAVRQVSDAKSQATRDKRIAGIVAGF